MSVTRPYYRTVRQYLDGSYEKRGYGMDYVAHPAYATDAGTYIRSFELVQHDLVQLFQYIEPADENEGAYSLRTYEILLRICTEVEANCKVILRANGYVGKQLTMHDYRKVNQSHFLSLYRVQVPYWSGRASERLPFGEWGADEPVAPSWYSAYSNAKHDRAGLLQRATFSTVVDAMCGLVVLLSAQFHTKDFSPRGTPVTVGGKGDGFSQAIGGLFRVRFPDSISPDERYEFEWDDIKEEQDPFERFLYS